MNIFFIDMYNSRGRVSDTQQDTQRGLVACAQKYASLPALIGVNEECYISYWTHFLLCENVFDFFTMISKIRTESRSSPGEEGGGGGGGGGVTFTEKNTFLHPLPIHKHQSSIFLADIL